MEESVEEPVGLVERVCAIDIGKAGLVVCVRVPHASRPGRRMQEVREYDTTTPALLGLADWLHRQQVQLVAMAMSDSPRRHLDSREALMSELMATTTVTSCWRRVLRDFADRARADVENDPNNTDSRRWWAKTAEQMLAQIDAALS